ncbi:MAG: hypothetical protein JXR77_05585 [Lentisphaeria bacterium]|nr:hypothetical protein [Lentisphaeria bacterium]
MRDVRNVLWAAVLLAGLGLSGTARAQEKVELEIVLPRPMFTGTPKHIKTANLEPPRKEQKRPAFLVPKGTVNLAAGKDVSGSDEEPVIGELEQITDGDKEGVEGSYVELGPGKQWVQIDLEKKAKVYAVVVWHFHSQARVYHDVVVQTADDEDFIANVQTVYNNDHDNSAGLGVGKDHEYIETFEGRLIPVDGVAGRYLRLYSNGNTSDEMNHYTEIEVFGIAE